MKIIEKKYLKEFPFDWVDLNNYPNSIGNKVEIYIQNSNNLRNDFLKLFDDLFGYMKDEIFIYSDSWWDYTIDTWDINENEYNYNLNNKSDLSIEYLEMLDNNSIEIGYSGCCICHDWDTYLKITLDSLIANQAIYSHIYFGINSEFFFYFHISGSIGLYYKEINPQITRILKIAGNEYVVKR